MDNMKYELEKLEVAPDDIVICYLHVAHLHREHIPKYMDEVREGFDQLLPDQKKIVIGKYGDTLRTSLEAVPKAELIILLTELTGE